MPLTVNWTARSHWSSQTSALFGARQLRSGAATQLRHDGEQQREPHGTSSCGAGAKRSRTPAHLMRTMISTRCCGTIHAPLHGMLSVNSAQPEQPGRAEPLCPP